MTRYKYSRKKTKVYDAAQETWAHFLGFSSAAELDEYARNIENKLNARRALAWERALNS